MNKKELEKMFDEKFGILIGNQLEIDQINEFIFNEIIPEVLKSIMLNKKNTDDNDYYELGYNSCIEDIKQKAKDLYSVTL